MVDFADTKSLMQRVVNHFKSEIAAIRTGRAVPALVENISCSAYGGSSKLTVKELGTITAADAHSLIIQPWDPSVIGEIRQGILAANVGLTPVIDNNVIRIAVPVLTTEGRQEYIKLLHQKMEEVKVSLRNVRQDKKREIERDFLDKKISEDEKFAAGEELQKMTDEHVERIEELGAKKAQEMTLV